MINGTVNYTGHFKNRTNKSAPSRGYYYNTISYEKLYFDQVNLSYKYFYIEKNTPEEITKNLIKNLVFHYSVIFLYTLSSHRHKLFITFISILLSSLVIE